MLDYNHRMSVCRQDAVSGVKSTVYENILCDVQINHNKKYSSGHNSDNSELADFFIFTTKNYKDLKIGDVITFNNGFGETVTTVVMSKDFVNFSTVEPFIEILVKKK